MKKQFYPKLSNSLVRGRNAGRNLAWMFGSVAGVVTLLFLLRTFLPSVLVFAATPLWTGGTKLEAGVGAVFSGFGNSVKLTQQNTALSAQLSELQNENAVLTARAQDLTKLLGGQSGSEANILGGVLARPPQSPYDTMVVNVGSKDGVIIGAIAYASGGIPIGTIRSVAPHTATIELLSTAGRTTDAWIGVDRIALSINGLGGGTFAARLPKSVPVSVGDSVYVPGPGAIPIATVARVKTDPSSPTVDLYLQPMVNIFSLPWVEISRTTQAAI
jgi:cell shape-determining protein MreC